MLAEHVGHDEGWRAQLKQEIASIRWLGVEEKSEALQDNYGFAVRLLIDWNTRRAEYLVERESNAGSVVGLLENEVEEAREKEPLYQDLLEEGCSSEWSLDPRARERWDVASEHADVLIFVARSLERSGWSFEQVALFWQFSGGVEGGESSLSKLEMVSAEAKQHILNLGLNPAEAIIEKISLNNQHHPDFFCPEVLANGAGKILMRNMREGIGPNNSQIPPLVTSILGPTILSRVFEAPYGSNGFTAKTFEVIGDGEVAAAEFDGSTNSYGGLYR